MVSRRIRKVLVTGGAGFIGSHIADELLERKYEVGILDNFLTGDRANIKQIRNSLELHEVDLRDWEKVRGALNGYDAIIHQGALVSVTRSVEDPLSTNSTNVTGTINLLKAAVDTGVRRVVYASSSSVYGETEKLPKKEDMPSRPISPYAVSKLSAENYCVAFARVYGLGTVCLRYFNVYGPRQKYGPYSGVIPTFIKRVQNDDPPIIFGDGEQTRDFTYVHDVVQANLLSLTGDLAPGEIFNVAAGRTCTINELAANISSLMGKPHLKALHMAERKGDIRASYADINKARKVLGYQPKFELEKGLRRTIDWFEANPL